MNDFFNLLGDFFQNRPLTNEEQILLLILGILILTIGIIIGWIIQGLTTRRYKKELLLLRKDRDEFEARYRAGETKQKALAKELEAVSREKVEALDRIQGIQNDLSARDTQIAQLQRSNEELTATNQSYTGTIESLNDEVAGLKTQNAQLQERADAVVVPTEDNTGGGAGAENGQERNENLNAYIATSEARFRELELRLREMNRENQELMLSGRTAAPTNPYTGHQPVVDPRLSGSTEPLVIRADTTEPGARTGNQGGTEVIVETTPSIHVPSISSTEVPETDDLTLIDNIGPFLQGKLNEADIYRYEQIANWTEADIVTYTNLIGYIPGIIQRDDWVGQARGLAISEAAHQPGDDEEMAFAASTAPTPVEADNEAAEDNLKVVEGIGPKIESILKASGIRTLGVLADTPTERLREILDEAGSRFKSHDPKTWAVQAGLAADGKLEELKAWQKELKGGK